MLLFGGGCFLKRGFKFVVCGMTEMVIIINNLRQKFEKAIIKHVLHTQPPY
jgi:hypothetical protein